MIGSIWVAVLAAAAAAVSFAVTGILQHRATARAPLRPALHPSLLYDLARQPLWLISIAAGLTAFALQAAALRFGPLALVQPILAMQVLVAPLLAAAVFHRRFHRELLLGAALVVIGLSAFLIAGAPRAAAAGEAAREGVTSAPNPLFLALVALLFVGFLAAAVRLPRVARGQGWVRALVLALGSGVLYGVTAGLLKVTVERAEDGLAAPLGSWTLYALLIAGPAGFLLNQNAFQAGPFVTPIAVITVTDPLVAIGIGLLWLNERINATPWAIVAELVGLAIMALGIVVLARRLSRTSPAAAPAGSPPDKIGAGTSAAEPCPSCP